MALALPSLFSTPSSAAGRVKKATSRVLMGPDWMINLHICDSINADPWQANVVVKSVKKRLQNKNSRVQFLALTLLETMVKNCGDFLHFQVVDHGILQEMVKIVRRTKNMQVREKILGLLQFWQVAFGGPDGKFPQFYYTYAELQRSGIRFPQMQRKAELIDPSVMPITNHTQVGYGMPSNSVERLDEVMASEMVHCSLSDLQNVRSVVELLMNMLQAVNTKDNTVSKDEVIIDLANQCRINQRKLLKLINSSDNDHLLGEALTLYDNVRVAIAKYEELASGAPLPSDSSDALPASSSPSPAEICQVEDKEEDEDGFSGLAKRHSMLESTGKEEVLPNLIDISTATSVTIASEGSSVENAALVLFDPSVALTSPKKTEGMIDLLSLTLTTNQSPQTPHEQPLLPAPSSNQNQNPFSNSPSFELYPNAGHPIMPNYSQPLMLNEGYTTNHSYVATWAQPVIAQSTVPLPQVLPHQQQPVYPNDLLPQTWTTTASSNPFFSTSSIEYAASQSTTSLGPAAPAVSVQEFQVSQMFGSFVSRDSQVNVDLKKTAPSTAPKAYMPDRLFDDLIELRNRDGSLKSRNASNLLSFPVAKR